MILYYIAMTLSTLFLIMCILSALSEVRPPFRASSRNFFRGFLINARDVSPYIAVVLLILCIVNAKNGDEKWFCLFITSLIFAIGCGIIFAPWMHGHARSKKVKKVSPIAPTLPEIKGEVGELSELGVLNEVSELNELPLTPLNGESENEEEKEIEK